MAFKVPYQSYPALPQSQGGLLIARNFAEVERALASVDLGPLPTWTPVVSQGVTPTQTINYAGWQRVGRMITAICSVSLTSAGTAAQSIVLAGLPVEARSGGLIIGSFRYFDPGNTNFAGTPIGASTTSCIFLHDGDGNALGAGTPTIASGDVLQFFAVYEAAA